MLDYYLIFRLVRKISKPFNEWEAFKAGVIDDKGEILVRPLARTPAQNRTFDKIDLICLKLRKILSKMNIPVNPAMSTAAALWLMREAVETDYHKMLNETVEDCSSLSVYMEQLIQLSEEDAGGAPTTNTSLMAGYPNADKGPRLGTLKRKKKERSHDGN